MKALIKALPKFAILLVLLLGVVGCSLLKKNPAGRKFHFDRLWARHTLTDDYNGFRIIHRMQPVLFGEFVFQGNAIDGISAFNKKTGNLQWHRHIKGGVEAGAVLGGSTLFFGGNDGFFYAVDAYTGRSRWTFPLRAEGLGRPIFHDGVVYFLTGNNMAYALKADSGEQLWLYSRIDGSNITVRGSGEPTVADDKILFGFSDGFLVALNKKSGSVIWEKRLGTNPRFKDVDVKPIVRDDRIYVSSYDGLFYCLQLKDGSVIWTSEDGGFQTANLHEDRIFLTTSDSRVVALDIKSGKRIWEKPLKLTVGSAPQYYRGLLIFGEWQGELRALDALTGQSVDSYSTGRGLISPVRIDYDSQIAYVMGTDGDLYAFQLNWQKPSERWEWQKSL